MTEDRREAPRLPVAATVSGRYPATPFSAEIADVSRSGCKLVATSRPIPVGSTILLDLSENVCAAGQAVWSEGSSLGVRFHEKLGHECVAELASRDFIVTSGELLGK